MNDGILLIVELVLCVGAYIGQRIVIQSLWKSKRVNLSTGRLWSALAFLGVLLFTGVIAMGGSLSELMSEGVWALVIFLVSVAAFVILLVRNIKGAGAGLGIVLTILQTLSGLLVLILGVAKISANMAGVNLAPSASAEEIRKRQTAVEAERAAQNRELEREEQEAYAQNQGFSNAQEAADFGDRSIDLDLLDK